MPDQPTHGDLYLLLGELKGELKGLRNDIKANGAHAKAVEDKVDTLTDRVNNGEIWRAEVRGMGRGVKTGIVLAAGGAGAGLVKAAEWAAGKIG
jgi:hypothetical protein